LPHVACDPRYDFNVPITPHVVEGFGVAGFKPDSQPSTSTYKIPNPKTLKP